MFYDINSIAYTFNEGREKREKNHRKSNVGKNKTAKYYDRSKNKPRQIKIEYNRIASKSLVTALCADQHE